MIYYKSRTSDIFPAVLPESISQALAIVAFIFHVEQVERDRIAWSCPACGERALRCAAALASLRRAKLCGTCHLN